MKDLTKRRLHARAIAFLAAAIMVVPGARLVAQSIDATHTPRIIAVFSKITAPADLEPLGRVLYQAYLQAIRAGRSDLRVVEDATVDAGQENGRLTVLARDIGSDAWSSIEISVSRSGSSSPIQAKVTYRVFDIVTARLLGSGTFTKEVDSRLRNVSPVFWQDAASLSTDNLTPRNTGQKVTIVGVPNTRLVAQSGTKKDRVVVNTGTSGEATLSLVAPGTFQLDGRATGYYPVNTAFALFDKPVTVKLAQDRRSPLAFELLMENGSFPQLGLAWTIAPDWLFLRAFLGGYAVSFLPQKQNGEQPLYASLPLATLGAGFGVYLTPPAGSFRLYLYASGFVRYEFPNGYAGIDTVTPGGVTGGVGFELLPNSPLRGVFEIAPRVYYAADPERALASVDNSGGGIPYLRLGNFLLDPVSFYIGARFQPGMVAK